jgi:hypothetical protein
MTLQNNHPIVGSGTGSPATDSPMQHPLRETDTDIEEAALLLRNMRRSNDHFDEYAAVLNTVFRRIIAKELDKQ